MSGPRTFKEIEALVLHVKKQTVALAAAQSEDALMAVNEAREKNIINAILVGDTGKIKAILEKNGIDPNHYTLIEEKEPKKAAKKAVELIRTGEAQLLMKGNVETGQFIKEVLAPEGLRTEKRLCSVVVMECQAINRLLILADVGTNIAPGIEEKASIIESCFEVANALGIENPKAAVLCAIEKVQQASMPITVEAAILSKMAERGQIKGGIVDGPISMDIAVNKHAAEIKGFTGKIAGDADILIAPDLEAGNILIKGLMYLTDNVKVAGIGMGAKAPMVITSRGDDKVTKYYSILLASLVSYASNRG